MILKEFAVYDRVVGEYGFTYKAQNEQVFKRIVKSAMLSKEPNVFTTNTEDKDIYCVAEFDTITGIVTGLAAPVFVLRLEELRQELILEIKKRKQEAGIEEGAENE